MGSSPQRAAPEELYVDPNVREQITTKLKEVTNDANVRNGNLPTNEIYNRVSKLVSLPHDYIQPILQTNNAGYINANNTNAEQREIPKERFERSAREREEFNKSKEWDSYRAVKNTYRDRKRQNRFFYYYAKPNCRKRK